MRRYLRWLGRGLGGLLVLVILFIVFVYATSGMALRRKYQADGHALVVPTDSAAIAHGARLTRILGCYGSCHGETGGGQLIDERFLAVGAIPDLTRLVRDYDDAQLERVIRHGIKPDGRSVLEFMPSEMFSHLSDEDLGAVIAFLRSLTPANGPPPGLHFRPLARTMMALGKIRFAAQNIEEPVTHNPPSQADAIAFGRYLALSACSECHGADLSGDNDGIPPDLRIGGAYSPGQFTRLMREGIPLDGRDLDLMKEVAIGRFSHFTDQELAALHAYVSARAREEIDVPAALE